MPKAALIMDMPDRCCKCRMSDCRSYGQYCKAVHKYTSQKGKESPDWCPLVEIPFDVNDSVYLLKDQRIFEAFVYEIHILISKRIVFQTVIAEDTPDGCRAYVDEFSYDDIGETVFLTRSEAEARLKEMEEDNER